MTSKPIVQGVRQVGLSAEAPEVLAEFYQGVPGLHIVGQGEVTPDGVMSSVFLSNWPQEQRHQLVIYANPEIRHTAIQVDSLASLQTLYQRVVDRGLPIRWVLNHGVSLAFYFSDPASNLIKLYWPTGIAYPQPHGHPIDLNQSEAALRQDVANLMAQFKLSKEGNSGLA